MANMIDLRKKVVMVVPELEDIARLKRYAIERNMFNSRGEPNVGGAICEITSLEVRRLYPELTPDEYRWCADQQEMNEAARKEKKSRKAKKGRK